MNCETARAQVLSVPYLDVAKQAKHLNKHLDDPYAIRASNTTYTFSVFSKVKKPLFVFKKLANNLIANLEIPVGQKVHASYIIKNGKLTPWLREWKLRASGAIVHSLCTREGDTRQRGYSKHDGNFVYRPGPELLKPDNFSLEPDECAGGIHFFLNLKDAWFY